MSDPILTGFFGQVLQIAGPQAAVGGAIYLLLGSKIKALTKDIAVLQASVDRVCKSVGEHEKELAYAKGLRNGANHGQ